MFKAIGMRHFEFKEVLDKSYINILRMVKKALNWCDILFFSSNVRLRNHVIFLQNQKFTILNNNETLQNY